MKRDLPIGILDSGIGGVGVLSRCLALLPRERFLYYGDNAHFPYGGKTAASVRDAVFRAVEAMGPLKGLVLACNTATSAAAVDLRAAYPMPVLGMEPALKPAVERGGRVAVLATALTLKEEKFKNLLAEFPNADIRLLPAPGLADLVEAGKYGGEEARAYLARLFSGLGPVDDIVLGCTHYGFVLPHIRAFYPAAAIFEGSGGTVRHLLRRLEETEALGTGGGLEIRCSGDPAFARRLPQFLDDISAIFAAESHRLL